MHEKKEAERLYKVWRILSKAANRLMNVYFHEFMEIEGMVKDENGFYKADDMEDT